jgi:hypothetical protein
MKPLIQLGKGIRAPGVMKLYSDFRTSQSYRVSIATNLKGSGTKKEAGNR